MDLTRLEHYPSIAITKEGEKPYEYTSSGSGCVTIIWLKVCNSKIQKGTNTEKLGVETMAKLISKNTDIQLVRMIEPNY